MMANVHINEVELIGVAFMDYLVEVLPVEDPTHTGRILSKKWGPLYIYM